MKKIISYILAAVFSLGVMYVNSDVVNAKASEEDVTIQVLDEYLQKSGYSEDFIENTQEEEKRRIYNFGAVFESETKYSSNSDNIAGNYQVSITDYSIETKATFSATLTCSHISYENQTTRKLITYNWSIDGTLKKCYEDIITLSWTNDFTPEIEYIYFSYYVQGQLTSSYKPRPDMDIPTVETKTIYSGWGNDAISTFSPELGFSNRFQLVKRNYQFTRYFSSGSYGNYKITRHRGTYSVILSDVNTPGYNPTCAASGSYFHQYREPLSLGKPWVIFKKNAETYLYGNQDTLDSYKRMPTAWVTYNYKD